MKNPIVLFLFISFVFSWSVAATLKITVGINNSYAGLFLFAYMWGPAIAAFICAWRFDAGQRAEVLGVNINFRRPGLWLGFLLAYLTPLTLILGATAVHVLISDVGLQSPLEGMKALMKEAGQNPSALNNLPSPEILLALQFFILAPLINLPLMASEELGWRGWLWHYLRPKGFWQATFWIGLAWGLWHIPIVAMGHNYPGMPVWGPIIFTIMCLLIAPAYSLVREMTGTVWAACLMHGTMNGAAAFGFIIQTQTDMPYRGAVGIGGFVAAAVISVLIFLFYRPNKAVTIKA